MRVCSERLASYIPEHTVTTVRGAPGRTDLDDGPLLDAITSLCEAFVTVDRSLRFQQNLRGRPVRIMLLRAHSNALEHLVPLVTPLMAALADPRSLTGGRRAYSLSPRGGSSSMWMARPTRERSSECSGRSEHRVSGYP